MDKRSLIPLSIAALVTGAALGYGECNPGPKISEDPPASKNNYFTKKDIDQIYEATYRVNTRVRLEKKLDGNDQKLWFGSGTLLADSQTGDNYVLTANHVTPGADYKSKKTGETAKVLEGTMAVYIYDAAIFKKNEDYDLALLKLDGSPGKPFTGKIAKHLDPNGYVIGFGFPDGNQEMFSTRVTKTTPKYTYLDMVFVGGNSGGGIYLIQNKELQLCGMVAETTPTAAISPSLERVRDFFKSTPLEDDYLQ